MPLFLFTILGSLAAGVYAAAAAFPKVAEGKKSLTVPIVALTLLVLGGVALMFHLGRPDRLLLAFRNISAGITQEAFASIAFGVVIVVDLILAIMKKPVSQVLRWAGAALGLVLVLVMAGAYFSITVNDAMHSWETFALFVFSAAGLGTAFAGMLCRDAEESGKIAKVSMIVIVLAALSMLLEGIHYMVCGLDLMLFIVAAVLAAVAAVCAWLAPKKGSAVAIAAFALIVVAVAISRYAFYLAI